MVGRTIGKYRIVEQIGRGGMGTVYKAIDETLDRPVAIKVLNADLLEQESVERFRREAMTLARLNHPRIGTIHELTRDGHDLLMVMEFIEGETFEKLIERAAPLPIPQAVNLCMRVLDALEYAHRAGVVHRDLKPANVIVTPDGDIKVMDFGIARVQGSEHLTTHGFMVGTPAYMSPEQVRGEESDPRMDLYSIAVVLYRLLTHRLPFQGDTAIAMIHSQLNNAPTPPRHFRADLPDWLVATLSRGLAKAPGDRFQTAVEFRVTLEGGLAGTSRIPVALSDVEETIGPMLTPPAMPVPPTTPTPSAPVPLAAPAVLAAASPPPASPAAAPAKPEGTVTLRIPHLATAGGLVALLLVGIGILAFIALRRPSGVASPPAASSEQASNQTASATAPATQPQASQEPPTGGASATATPPSAASAEPTTPAASPSQASAPSAPGAESKPAAPATAAASATASGSRGSGPGNRPGSTRARGSTAPPVSEPATPPVPAAPAAADAPTQDFGEVKVIVLEGTKSREADALLAFEPGRLVVRGRGDDITVLRTLPYGAIAASTYARARRPRAQREPNLVEVPDNLGGSGFFLGSARHWLTLQTPKDFLILRLEDRNVIGVLNALEARTGNKVVRNRGD